MYFKLGSYIILATSVLIFFIALNVLSDRHAVFCLRSTHTHTHTHTHCVLEAWQKHSDW